MKRITQKSIPSIICWLWNVAKGNRLQTTLNAIIGILDVTISLLTVYAMRHAIDVAAHDVEGDLIWAICFIGIITIADFSLIISSIWVRSILGIKAQNRMQQRMIERVIRSEWQSKATHHSGDIMNRLEGDVGTVVGFLTETLPSALSTLLLFTGAFIYLYSMDSMLALITIAIVPLCIVMSKFYVRKMRKLNRIVRDSDSQIQSVMQDIVQHMLVIKTLESDKLMVSRLKSSQQELHDNIVRRTIFSVMSNLTVNLGFSISYLFTFAWSAFRLSAGDRTSVV